MQPTKNKSSFYQKAGLLLIIIGGLIFTYVTLSYPADGSDPYTSSPLWVILGWAAVISIVVGTSSIAIWLRAGRKTRTQQEQQAITRSLHSDLLMSINATYIVTAGLALVFSFIASDTSGLFALLYGLPSLLIAPIVIIIDMIILIKKVKMNHKWLIGVVLPVACAHVTLSLLTMTGL